VPQAVSSWRLECNVLASKRIVGTPLWIYFV